MPRSFPLEHIRNIGIIAHIDAGKTTVTEKILYFTGRTYKIGNVDEGTTVMDWMDQERERGITIKAAATTCAWKEFRINIIDTPGHVDFTAEVERSLRVLDGGVVVLDAVAGVEAQSETVWRQANKYHVPRLCYINKMDRVGADFYRTIGMIQSRLKAIPLPVQLPIGSEDKFEGIIDVLENKAWRLTQDPDVPPQEIPVPEAEKARLAEYRHSLLEKLAESDDQFMMVYLEGNESSVSDLKQALRRATIANKVVPVVCGSALRNKGVQPLLDAVTDYLPSPLDIPPVVGSDINTGEPVSRAPDDDAPFSALAFKVVSDPYVGRLVYFRIYSGKIAVGDQVHNSARDKKERIGRLVLMHANHREEITEADTGAIIATLGLKNTFTGDTLCSSAEPILLEPIKFPEPVIFIAIEPKTRADQDKLGEALQKLTEEDPTFKVNYNSETGQTIISGMGELHLEVIVTRLIREFKVAAAVGNPKVAYKETIKAAVKDVAGKFIRQSGGHGQYGHVVLDIEPQLRGAGFEFVNAIRGGAIPRSFIPAVEDGVREAMENGVLGGYPAVDVKVTLVDGSFHDVDSSEIAFKMAGSIGLKEGMKRAKPVLLEPIMKLEVVTPEQFLGDIIGNLNSKRGQVESVESRTDMFVVTCYVPLAETFGYATTIRSLTQGRASYTMEFNRYQETPAQITEEIIEKA